MGEIRSIQRPVITPEAQKRAWAEWQKVVAESRAKLSPEEQRELADRDKRLEPLQGLRDLCDSSGW